MKNMKKRVLSIALMLAMVVALIPLSSIKANADQGTTNVLFCPTHEACHIVVKGEDPNDTTKIIVDYYSSSGLCIFMNESMSKEDLFNDTSLAVPGTYYLDAQDQWVEGSCSDCVFYSFPSTISCSEQHTIHWYVYKISGTKAYFVCYSEYGTFGDYANVSDFEGMLGSCEVGVYYYLL